MPTPKNFTVYRASAGSGKTFTLVREYLTLALCGGSDEAIKHDFRHILAITFTNKATNQMKERILDYLGNLSDPQKRNDKKYRPMVEALCKELNISIDELSRRCRLLETSILHNYSDFSVCTIDSFMNRIIRTFAIDLGLSPRFELSLDTKKVLESAVDSLIDDISDEHPELAEVIMRFARSNMEDGNSFNLRNKIMNGSKSIMDEDIAMKIDKLKDISLEDFGDIAEKLRSRIKDISEENKTKAQEICGLAETNNLDHADFKGGMRNGALLYFQNIVEKGEKKFWPTDTVKGNFDDNDIVNPKSKNTAALQRVVPEMMKAFHFIVENTRHIIACKALLQNLFQMALLKELQKKVNLYYAENDILHISENNKRISEAVQNEEAPFIFERLGCRYRHFLIDEFQDTSIMQWHNLLPLIDNGLSEGNKSIIVGDGKQAIYRFRQGDVEQFQYVLKVPDNVSATTRQRYQTIIRNGEEENLDTNYRSFERIVDFNNRMFPHLEKGLLGGETGSQLMDDIYIGENTKKPLLYQEVAEDKKGGGYVEVHFWQKQAKKKNDAEEVEPSDNSKMPAMSIYEVLKHLKSIGYSYKDIAILARKNDQLSNLSADLNCINDEKGELPDLQFSSPDSLKLTKSGDAKFLLSLLGYLNDAINQVFWLEIADYLFCKGYEQFGSTLFTQKDAFEKVLSEQFPAFKRDKLLSQTLYDCCYQLIRIFDIPKTPFVYTFLNKVADYSVFNRTDIGEFYEWFNDQFKTLSTKTSDDLDAIRLMSVHKSKGLEFPVVIYHKVESDPKGDSMWVDLTKTDFAEAQPLEIGLVTKTKDLRNSALADEFNEESQKNEIDELNVFYVAMTRPEQHLYLYMEQPPQKNTTVRYAPFVKSFVSNPESDFSSNPELCVGDEEVFSIGDRDFIKKDDTALPGNYILGDNKSKPWYDELRIVGRSESIMNYQQTEQQQVGNIVHDILSRIGTLNEADAAMAAFLSETKLDDDVKGKVKTLMDSVLHSDEVKRFFNPEYGYKTECEIMHKGEIVRPDRIVFAPNETWVVDFKTGNHDPRYATQVNGYMAVLKEMGYPDVKGFLMYIGSDGCKVETV